MVLLDIDISYCSSNKHGAILILEDLFGSDNEPDTSSTASKLTGIPLVVPLSAIGKRLAVWYLAILVFVNGLMQTLSIAFDGEAVAVKLMASF